MMMMKAKNNLTLTLINFAAIIEMADESLLPGVYKEVGKDLNIDPAGSLSLYRSLVQCLCYPLAAFLAACHNRANVIALGAFLWFLVAISSTFAEIAISRALTFGTSAQKVFGYKPIPEGSSSSGEIETDRQNAASLAKAMYTAIGIPMVICCSIYSFLYFTYPRDRDRVLSQQIDETHNHPYEEQQPLLEQRLLSVN
ncbi:hypothetical protein MTR67_024563 [Solanum verrucosum]|uniref:Uncharacterized protein n=1 Tax=Solanum verrucosum TaxID=315347 RepID=A0AAF0TZ21_SOLVR|nr:hypothetical protein MTR67_024563 [Solanum verrucosum]